MTVGITAADEPQPIFVPWAGSPYAAAYQPEDITIGDFNGDGNVDVATSSTQGSVGLLLGRGDRTLVPSPASPFYTGFGFIRSVRAADFDGDGNLDVAGVDTFTSSILIMKGDGAGGLTPASGSPYPGGNWAWRMAVGDFDGDGRVDIAIADSGAYTALVALNDGAGNFPIALQRSYPVGANPVDILVVDLNKDGFPDLITADYNQDALSILLNDGTGGFFESPTSPVSSDGWRPERLVAADFDEDGNPDIACVNEDNSLAIFRGDGHGNLEEVGEPIPVAAWALAAGDVDGDGHEDIVTGSREVGDLYLLRGDGQGNFSAHAFESVLSQSTYSLQIANADRGHQVVASSFFDGVVDVLEYLKSDRLFADGFDRS